MATTPKFAQELAKKIINTRGVLKSERDEARGYMDTIVDGTGIQVVEPRAMLLALQVAARDEQVWTALVSARAALNPPKPPVR